MKPLMPLPTLDLEASQGIEVVLARVSDNDLKEPLLLWNGDLQKLQQVANTDLRLLCFPAKLPRFKKVSPSS
mgnify:CR=1 FL=1